MGLRGVVSDITERKKAEEDRIRKIKMVNEQLNEFFSTLAIDISPSIPKEEKGNVILFMEDWDDKYGPFLHKYYPKDQDLPFSMKIAGVQLYNSIATIYGQANITEAQGILLNIENIQRNGYIYFDSLKDFKVRGRERQFMLGVLAPKINYFASLKIKEEFQAISDKIKRKKDWDIELYWDKISNILSTQSIKQIGE